MRCRLKTLFNIVEAPLKKKLLNFDVCVVWWCSDRPLNSQEYKSFEMHAVSIKISVTEYITKKVTQHDFDRLHYFYPGFVFIK